MATVSTETARKPSVAPLDPSSLSKWHDPSKLRQRGGIFRPSKENPLIGLLLALPKKAKTPRKTPKKRKSSRVELSDVDNDGPPQNDGFAPPSSPLGEKSTVKLGGKRKSVAALRKSLAHDQSSDAEQTLRKSRRKSRRTSDVDDVAESSFSMRSSGRIKLSDLAAATSPPTIDNPIVSSVPRRQLSPIAESSPAIHKPEPALNPKLTSKPKAAAKRKQDPLEFFDDEERPSPPKRPRKAPANAKQPSATREEADPKPSKPSKAKTLLKETKAALKKAVSTRQPSPTLDSTEPMLIDEEPDEVAEEMPVRPKKPTGASLATAKPMPPSRPPAPTTIAQSEPEVVHQLSAKSRGKKKAVEEDDVEPKKPKGKKTAKAVDGKGAGKPKSPRKPKAKQAKKPSRRKKVAPELEPEDEGADPDNSNMDGIVLVKTHDGPSEPKKGKRAAAPRKSFFDRAGARSDDEDPLDLFK